AGAQHTFGRGRLLLADLLSLLLRADASGSGAGVEQAGSRGKPPGREGSGWRMTMPSRFPGLDPFLEGQAWSDFHNEFIIGLRRALVRDLPARYAAVVEERLYVEIEPGEQPGPIR